MKKKDFLVLCKKLVCCYMTLSLRITQYDAKYTIMQVVTKNKNSYRYESIINHCFLNYLFLTVSYDKIFPSPPVKISVLPLIQT